MNQENLNQETLNKDNLNENTANLQEVTAENCAELNEEAVENPTESEFSNFNDEEEAQKEQAELDKKAQEDMLLPPDPDAILEVRHLKKHFVLKKTLLGKPLSTLKAVDDVSFVLHEGETLGIVGESGCGKTTMGRTILKLHQPTAGQIFFRGQDIAKYSSKQMRSLRTEIQIVFQDPYSSLPPRSTVGGILAEPVRVHKIVPEDQIKDYVLKLMESCGLRDYYYERYPHEFSGGQRQRIGIARALILNPDFIIADEPISALDVSIQAQVINLLNELRETLGLTILFIAHDLSVVKYFSDRIGVMYFGNMVELASSEELFKHPLHPYTKSLLSAIPLPDPYYEKHRQRIVYNALSEHDYSVDKPSMREIAPGHFIYCNDQEEEKYKKELQE